MGRPRNRSADAVIETAERRAKVVEMRRQRKTFAEIGRELGVTGQRAFTIYREALAEIPAQQVDEHRAEELLHLDFLASKAMEVLLRHHVTVSNGRVVYLEEGGEPVEDDSPVLAAIDRLLKIQERKAKLLGLDAPMRAEVVTIDAIDAEIARLTAELSVGSEAEEAGAASGASD